ncbi:MAG: hypothetical protein IPO67_21880 [Deltaproteobacteria bacterium]|nr:hypothetical protein [Deltaproteobacteria bacterium]
MIGGSLRAFTEADSRAAMPPGLYALWRLSLGALLTGHFVRVLPYTDELYAKGGLDLGETAFWVVFPSPLFVLDSPAFVTFWHLLGLGLSVCFALGLRRRLAALGLWFVLVSVLAKNPLVYDLTWGYTGWALLAAALTPTGEPRWPWQAPRRAEWAMPPTLYVGACAILAISTTVSGLSKLSRPEWLDGVAISSLLQMGVSREGPVVDALLALPPGLAAALSLFVLAAELLAAPLSIVWRGRMVAWTAMVLVHLGILLTVRIPELSLGMLSFHLLTMDTRWWSRAGLAAPPPSEPS